MKLLKILTLPFTVLLIGWGFLGCVGQLLELNPIEFLKVFLIFAVPAIFMTYEWFKESQNHAADLIIAFSLLGLVYGAFEDPALIIIATSGAPAALLVLLAIFSKYSYQKSVS